MKNRNSSPNKRYRPRNPSNVNKTLPECTSGDAPSAVRSSPYTSHGWRPSSVVIQPAVVAIYGKGTERRSSHNSHFDSNNRPRHNINSERLIIDTRIVPRPAMM